MVAKANSGTLSTGLWNAIDTDAVDTDRSQAGTLPRLLAERSVGSLKRAPLGANSTLPAARFPVIAIPLRLQGPLHFDCFFKS